MTWTQSDTRYAVATTIAAALVIGVLGIGVGVFSPTTIGVTPRDPFLPVVSLRLPDASQPTGASIAIANASLAPIAAAAPAPSVNLPAPRDQTSQPVQGAPPTVAINPPPPLVLTLTTALTGVASDDRSVSRVRVEYSSSLGEAETVDGVLTCASATSCNWTAAAPGTIGTYEAVAIATDSDGIATRSDPVDVTIVAPLALL